jgi:hypothetical protein
MEGQVSDKGMLPMGSVVKVSEGCRHEIDLEKVPKWDPRLGKLYTCKLCGAEVFRQDLWRPPVGEKLHLSKKDRRRRRLQGLK